MFKRILTVIISLILVLPSAVLAEGVTEILSPVNNSLVTPEFSQISVSTPSEGDTLVLYLDGEKIYSGAGGSVEHTLRSALAIGRHTLKAVTISESSAEEVISEFWVQTSAVVEITNDDMTGAPAVSNMSYYSATLTDSSGESAKISAKKVEGREGEGDSAFAFYCPVDAPASSSNINPYLSGDSMKLKWTGKIDMQMDLYFSDKAAFGFETNGPNSYSTFFGSYTPFSSSGFVNGKEYPVGEWFRLKILIDFDTLNSSMEIGRYNESGELTWISIYENYTQSPKIRKLTTFKIQPNFKSGTVAGQYIAIDNLKITEENVVSANAAISYPQGEEYEEAEGGTLPPATEKIRIATGSTFAAADVLSKTKVYCDDIEIPLTEAVIDENGLNISLSYPLWEEATLRVILSEDVLLINNEAVGSDVCYSFKTEKGSSVLSGVDIKVGDITLCSTNQLKAGAAVSADVSLSEAAAEREVSVILGIYDGAELIAMDCVSIDTSLYNSGRVSALLPASFSYTDGCIVKVFAIEGLSDSTPASREWSIN